MGLAEPQSTEVAAQATPSVVLSRLPPWLQQMVGWLLSRWPGRIALRAAATCIRIEVFDQSMAISARFFTSVFPVLILIATWVGGAGTDKVAEAINMPKQTRALLEEAVDGSGGVTFGVIGMLLVLVSATSLSRALTRVFASIWNLPRPKISLVSAWRWLTVVLALTLSLIVVHTMSGLVEGSPYGDPWYLVAALTFDVAVAVFVPWVLLSGAVRLRCLTPGALVFGLAMLAVRPATAAWLPRGLESSADLYGSIGVAFTYLAWLYVVAFSVLVSAVLGQVIATDRGRLGHWLCGHPPGDLK
jgi:membrane protein